MKGMWYDKEADVLNIEINDEDYWKSIELPNGVILDMTKEGVITSIEILNASKLLFGDAKKIIEIAEPIS